MVRLACVLAASGCGRLHFDASGDAVVDTARDAAADSTRDAAADAGGPPSCANLAPICGPAEASSCCDSKPVPGGTFFRSYDVATDNAYPSKAAPATVSDFRLDTYEITVGRFREFVAAGLGTQQTPPAAGVGAHAADPVGWDPSWDSGLASDTAALVAALTCNPTYATWTATPGANEALPINCITWLEAYAFCAWDGGYLPSEAQWNYAAAGGSEQRAYPWSSPPGSLTIDCSYANYDINVPAGTHCVGGTAGAPDRVGSQSPKGDGKWGQADLAGNLWEWTRDWYATYATPCDDCADLVPSSSRTSRGDSFYDSVLPRTGFRNTPTPTLRDLDFGARCARP